MYNQFSFVETIKTLKDSLEQLEKSTNKHEFAPLHISRTKAAIKSLENIDSGMYITPNGNTAIFMGQDYELAKAGLRRLFFLMSDILTCDSGFLDGIQSDAVWGMAFLNRLAFETLGGDRETTSCDSQKLNEILNPKNPNNNA